MTDLTPEMRAGIEGAKRERHRIIEIIESGTSKFIERAKLIRQINRNDR